MKIRSFSISFLLVEFASLRVCDGSDVFPDPTDCGYFFDCTNNYAVRQRCAPGTFFNDITKRCDFPENVPRCEKQLYGDSRNNYNLDGVVDPNEIIVVNPGNQDSATISDTPTKTSQASQTEFQNEKTDTVIINNKGNGNHDPFCFGRKVGNYPDPDFCNFFYQCSLSVSRRQRCAPGTVFNPKKDMCDFPSEVKHCENYFRISKGIPSTQIDAKTNIARAEDKNFRSYINRKSNFRLSPPATANSVNQVGTSTTDVMKQNAPRKEFSLTGAANEESSSKIVDTEKIKLPVTDAETDVNKNAEKSIKKTDSIFKQMTVDTSILRIGRRNLNMRFSLRDIIQSKGRNQDDTKETITTTTQPTSTRQIRSTTNVLPAGPTEISNDSVLANNFVLFSEENQSKVQKTGANDEVAKSSPRTFIMAKRNNPSSSNNFDFSEYMHVSPTKSERLGVTVYPMSASTDLEITTSANMQTTSNPITLDEAIQKVGDIVKQGTLQGILSNASPAPLDTYAVHVDGNGKASKIPVIEAGDINGNFRSQKGIRKSIGNIQKAGTEEKSLRASIEAKLRALKYLTTFIKSDRLNQIFKDTLRKSHLMDKMSKKYSSGSRMPVETDTKKKTVHYPRLIIVTSMGTGESDKKLLDQFEVGLTVNQQKSVV